MIVFRLQKERCSSLIFRTLKQSCAVEDCSPFVSATRNSIEYRGTHDCRYLWIGIITHVVLPFLMCPRRRRRRRRRKQKSFSRFDRGNQTFTLRMRIVHQMCHKKLLDKGILFSCQNSDHRTKQRDKRYLNNYHEFIYYEWLRALDWSVNQMARQEKVH